MMHPRVLVRMNGLSAWSRSTAIGQRQYLKRQTWFYWEKWSSLSFSLSLFHCLPEQQCLTCTQYIKCPACNDVTSRRDCCCALFIVIDNNQHTKLSVLYAISYVRWHISMRMHLDVYVCRQISLLASDCMRLCMHAYISVCVCVRVRVQVKSLTKTFWSASKWTNTVEIILWTTDLMPITWKRQAHKNDQLWAVQILYHFFAHAYSF